MAQNQSLSTQEVADILHVSKSTIYELIRRGEIHSYKVGRKVRFTQEDVDAYIARSRHEQSTQPIRRMDVYSTLLTQEETEPEFILSGQDVVLDVLANFLHRQGIPAGRAYLSGFEGLLALYQDKVSGAACHLFDGQGYNTGFVEKLMPGIPAVLVNISYRAQGFYVPKGNPKGIRGWEDLGREDIRLLNRRTGSSSRILLDMKLKELGIPGTGIPGYDTCMQSHLTMASAIAQGEADLALGTERVSHQIEGIDFIPLAEERFDLVFKKAALNQPAITALLHCLREPLFRRALEGFTGNDYRDLGKIIEEV